MVKKPTLSPAAIDVFKARFGKGKLFAQALMPVRGDSGFRKLDYDFAKTLDADAIIKKCRDNGFNAFGLVVKDTDGATLSDTKVGWNPTGVDSARRFEEACQRYEMSYILSVTNMNDAYRGAVHPESVSVHIKSGRPSTHKEGEMRVDIPPGKDLAAMRDLIPFLTDEKEEAAGKSRGARGVGYIPTTSFHCPRSEHIDYMIALVKELVRNYHVDGIFADYIRYDGRYTDLCGCHRCREAFAAKYPGKRVGRGKEWYDFKEDNIAEYGRKFNAAIKGVDPNVVTGWFNLPGPKLFTRDRIAQNYTKLGAALDVPVPMVYPYLMGTADDGRKWRFLADIAHWFSQLTMGMRFHEYGKDKPVLVITNSAECNAEELLMQCNTYDYGLGIAVFLYHGTTEQQWAACKLYGELLAKQKAGDPSPGDVEIRDILMRVYKAYPPKDPRFLKWKPKAVDTLYSAERAGP
ncbi:MAG: hypothetical protein JW839_00050 [Candidatus Lokiarchaeota archaeon]|nr:hypothetical protein [Candidatus Lokiarchaeota archaeon]